MIDLRTGPDNKSSGFCFKHSASGPRSERGQPGGMGDHKDDMAEVKKMTQTQLVKEIATATGISNKQAKAVLDKYVDIAIAQTKKVGVCVLPGIGRLKKVERKSPTLGAKPPQGAVVLFDGSSVEHFDGAVLTPEKWLTHECSSKAAFGDHKLHIEFRPPFKPLARGQARGNSGVYVQSRYEIQVLDSFGLEGENNECGGIYSIAKPGVNMCYPPLTWQTYDIEFKAARYENGQKVQNARVTLVHNGVKVLDDIELPAATPGRLAEGPDPAPLFLQGHGNPVVFRNIWVVEEN